MLGLLDRVIEHRTLDKDFATPIATYAASHPIRYSEPAIAKVALLLFFSSSVATIGERLGGQMAKRQ